MSGQGKGRGRKTMEEGQEGVARRTRGSLTQHDESNTQCRAIGTGIKMEKDVKFICNSLLV